MIISEEKGQKNEKKHFPNALYQLHVSSTVRQKK